MGSRDTSLEQHIMFKSVLCVIPIRSDCVNYSIDDACFVFEYFKLYQNRCRSLKDAVNNIDSKRNLALIRHDTTIVNKATVSSDASVGLG